MLPSLISSGEIKPTQFPVFLFYNVVMTNGGNCCIIGYHSAFQASGGVQTYATTDYVSKGLFNGPLTDIYAASHEVGEWINDPFVNNATPAWGHIGQVSGCQSEPRGRRPAERAAVGQRQDAQRCHLPQPGTRVPRLVLPDQVGRAQRMVLLAGHLHEQRWSGLLIS